MHENQFAYPDSGRQHSSAEPLMVNLSSAVAADRVLFNSAWNRESFLNGVRDFMNRMPDGLPDGLITGLSDKSRVLPVPIEDRLFGPSGRQLRTDCPHMLWYHRWEYDKTPDRLRLLLDALEDMGQDFRLSVVGEQFRKSPGVFDQIRQRHEARILDWGFLPDRAEYDRLLGRADVVVSTALHDFQGLAVLEVMAAGCVALAPDRLAYPEYVPASQRYASDENDPGAEALEAAKTLKGLLATPESIERRPPQLWRLSDLQKQYYQEIQTLLNHDQA
jgi:glycosyltransferase involved in cell wall biosynthesis